MQGWTRASLRVAIAAAVGLATANCGGSSGGSGLLPRQVPLGSPDAAASDSWIAPDAASQDLLYVSDVQEVRVYTYPRGKYEGTLLGFNIAQGECVDNAGNVYVVDEGYGKVFEYAHGSKKRLRTINSGFPEGCAIDPTTGNLAVATGRGVDIYTNAQGKPRYYRGPDFWEAYFCGYDGQGNLFVDGMNKLDGFEFAELPKGASKPIAVTLDQYISWPGGVQWDGTDVTVVDQGATNVYAFAINGSQGTLVRTTQLRSADEVVQPWIQGSQVIVPDSISGKPGHVLIYPYPAGGSPTKNISKDLHSPQGVTVSKAPT